jgi:hypothetical protein
MNEKEISELAYLLKNAPVNLTCRDHEIGFMNGSWYCFIAGSYQDKFDDFHLAMSWLVNQFWIKERGHPYSNSSLTSDEELLNQSEQDMKNVRSGKVP